MKIALLSFEYPPETGRGGIGTYTWYQARALVQLGHEVHVLAGATEQTDLTTTEHDGVSVHRYRCGGPVMAFARLFGLSRCFWTKQRIENAWCMYRGLKLLTKHRCFDLIEMPECGAEGALITYLVDTPTIVRFHSPSRLIMQFYDVPRADIIMCSWLEQLAIHQATALTSCSLFLAQEVRAVMGVDRHIEVIANGIDLPLFDLAPVANLQQLYGVPDGQVTILFAGRMERRKGIELCSEIVSSVLTNRKVTFLFAGEDIFHYLKDTLEPELMERDLLGSFRYLGKLSFEDLRACARAVDIYLLPSLWENAPYACLEAMASGRAIVCSDQGGMPELIQHEVNGLLAVSGLAASYVHQLQRMIDDPELRRVLGCKARQTVEEHFTDVRICALSEQVYRRTRAHSA